MKFIVGLLMVLGSLSAFAENPCAKDREKLCPGVEAGGGRIMKCMKENEAQLSAECKAHHQSLKAEMKELKEACHDDAEKICPNLKRRELMKCMRENKEKLSDTCKGEFKEMKEKRKK